MPTPADWQLPRGVSREVWDYLHDSTVTRRYDESLAGTPLLDLDHTFVERHYSSPGRVIDLGCGTGRIAIPLAQRGHAVTAVDLSAGMLRVAGEKALAAGVRLNRVQANIVELDGFRDATFDTAVCMFATLGMVAGADARRRVVGHAFRLLKPGGKFVIHVHSRWHHLRTAAGRRWLAGDLVRSIRGRDDAGDWRMVHHSGQTGWTMHLFTRGEITALLRSAGFAAVEVLPVGLGANGCLRWPWFLGGFRAYGFLIAARKPELTGGTGPATLS
jgi:ubiquinone/menaquinone biosynthesis C-methylase UbiE